MSNYSEKIQKILGYGNSKKITEKRKCITELLDLYNNEDAVNAISQSSKKKGNGVQNWSCIIHIVHNVLLNEADRLSVKDTYSRSRTEQKNTCTAVWKTVQYANSKAVPLLDCSDLLPLIFQILSGVIYEPYHETYIAILNTFVLPIRQHQVDISSEQWKELLNICVSLYHNCSVYTKKCSILNALQMIVNYGCTYSDLLLSVKKIFSFLETMFHDVKTNEEILAESAYKLCSTVCYHTSTECRIALCKLSENILPNIISFNSSSEKYKLLLLFVKIHHPRGATTIEDGAFATDWSEWIGIIKSIYDMLLNDSKPDILPDSFIQLASEVFKYVFEISGNILEIRSHEDTSYAQPAKRRRVSLKFDSLLNTITDRKAEDAWAIVQILTVLLEKYPKCLKSEDVPALLKIVVDLLTQSCKQEIMMDDLYKLCAVLVKRETIHSTANNESCNIHWDKIWDILLRSLNMNQNEVSGHKLAQHFIIYNKLKDPSNLLRSYLTNTIRWTPMSIRTLRVLCEHTPLPTDISVFNINSLSQTANAHTLRLHILKWSMNIPWPRLALHIQVEELSSLLLSIILKSKYPLNLNTEKHHDSSKCYCSEIGIISETLKQNCLSHTEDCYFLLAYKSNLFLKEGSNNCHDKRPDNDILYIQELLSYLIENLCDIKESTGSEDLPVIIIKIAVIAKIASVLIQLKIIPEDTDDSPLVSTLKAYLTTMCRSLPQVDPSKTKYIYLINIVKALNVLYKVPYHTAVTRILVSCSSLEMLESLFSLMNTEDDETLDFHLANDYIDDYNSIQDRRRRTDKDNTNKRCCLDCKEGVIRTLAAKALTLFCCMDAGSTKSKSQILLMENLFTIDMADLVGTVHLKVALIILQSLKNYGEEDLWKNCKETPIDVFLKLYHHCYEDRAAVLQILQIFPFFFQYARKYKVNTAMLINIINDIYTHLDGKRYGVITSVEYVKCISHIVRIDSATRCDSDTITSVEDKILTFLRSPVFAVRLQAVKCIQEIYSLQNISFKWKEEFFGKIEGILKNLFILNEEPEKHEKLDEKETRTATVLLLLTVIICTNGALQCRALEVMLALLVEHKIDVNTIQKALHSVRNEINHKNIFEENLKSLVIYWLKMKHPLELFPWPLLQCKSKEEFYKSYINILVVIQLEDFNMDEAKSICDQASLPFEQILQDVLPQTLTWIMCCMCKKTDDIMQRKARKVLYALSTNREEFQEMKKFSEIFDEKFDSILLCIIQGLHDEDYMYSTFGVQSAFPTSDPPHLKKAVVDCCLAFLEELYRKQGLGQENSIMHILASKKPNVLQNTLLSLNTNIYKMHFHEHKLKAFHQYIYFCTHVINVLKEDYLDQMTMFIVREIGYSLLHLIKFSDDTLSEPACKYFLTFLKCILPSRKKEVEEILNFTVMTLIAVVQTRRTSTALDVLEFLIINQQNVLCDAIEKLSAFPNITEFQEIRCIHNALKSKSGGERSLEDEIQHFLTTVVDKTANCSVEDISHLRLQLSTRKNVLRKMYEDLEQLRGFAEDCAASTLHQLVYRLVKLTGSEDRTVSMEAAKCLGELGPSDLTTMILHFGKSHIKETSFLIEIMTYMTLTRLTEFSIHSNIELRKSSANALYVVLSTPWGKGLLNETSINSIKHMLKDPNMVLRLDYIRPFIGTGKMKSARVGINKTNVARLFDSHNSIWTEKSDGPYQEWIIEMTSNVADCFTDFYSKSLIPVFQLSTDFCELILPRMIVFIYQLDNKMANALSSCINKFFDYHFNPVEDVNNSAYNFEKMPSCSHQIVHCMLNVVNYIRIQTVEECPLQLNYMFMARAAQYCSAYFTAILYAEMFCESEVAEKYSFGTIPKIDYMYEYMPEEGKLIQNILRHSYVKIGDPDAISGSGSSHLQDHATRTQYYVHTGKWNEVILTQDVELSCGNTSRIRDFANGLRQSGLEYLLGHFLSTVTKTAEKIDDDIQYECAWRLSDWNLCETTQKFKNDITESSYDFYHYQALKCVHENNDNGLQNALDSARMSIMKAFKNISLESSKTVYEKLMQLQMLREIEELSFANQENYKEVLQKWDSGATSICNEFQYIEPILTQRTVIYQIKDSVYENPIIKAALSNTFLEISKVAANHGHIHVAERALAVLARQPDLPPKIQDRLMYQESLLAWLRKDLQIGRYLLRSLIQKNSVEPSLAAQVLRVYGDWMAETKSENPQAVIQKYYIPSIEISSSINERDADVIKNLYDTQVALARFADAQFEQISSYMNSAQFTAMKQYVDLTSQGPGMSSTSKDKDVRRAEIINQRQNTQDVEKLKHIEKEKDTYLTLALRYYLRTLQQSEAYNLLIFRITALWLDNKKHEVVNELLNKEIDKIPSFKFIPLVPQLAAHMSNSNDQFSIKINRLMERCAMKHPHHTLPVLLALKNLYGDYEYNETKKNSRLKEEARVLGAKQLVGQLFRSDINPIIREMDKLSHSLVMLANLTIPQSKGNSVLKIPKGQEILKVTNFSNVIVPTLSLPVKPSGNYNVIGIYKYGDTYETVGGVNAPKKVVCIGVDGISRHQLVKGKDDLRQDAVMQQVFGVMNTLLKTCKETKRRKLIIRTYKIVPLTQRSGVLEWCDNTLPIVSVLVGSNSKPGLHKKYYPSDYSASTCREKMHEATKTVYENKSKVFLDCCKNMQPALHHFFTEKYPSPETWFERRLAYTRSVATTSMAGYILGLGDRHLSNMLIDQTTAEIIHIDFGIAFEQGKFLPIPETIPFRLTRNIEVAMGVSGVEGTMRRCCEETLTVMRNQRQIIITLLQVLLYDPLFSWAITPTKAYHVQGGGQSGSLPLKEGVTETNTSAARALLRVEQKLQGTEEGLSSSVPGQVERLIQEARDPFNLCRLFCGWQPYL